MYRPLSGHLKFESLMTSRMMQQSIGLLELAALGIHSVADVDGAAGEGEVVFAPIEIRLLSI